MATYIERKVRSAPGMTQEQALESLQSHPHFRSGTKIASIHRRGDRWMAVLHIPKTAGGFPPSDEGGEEEAPKLKGEPSDGPDDEGDDDAPDFGPGDDAGSDGPPKGDGPPKEDKKVGGDEQIVHLLTEILHALKGGPVGPELGGPDDLGPALDALGPPPPHGQGLPPTGPPKPGAAGIGAKLKPGEVPNKPGVTPVGAPAFSSTNPLYQRIASVAGRQRHIHVSSPVGMTIKQAKTELEPIANHFGYTVAQVRYCGQNCSCKSRGSNKIHALLAAK